MPAQDRCRMADAGVSLTHGPAARIEDGVRAAPMPAAAPALAHGRPWPLGASPAVEGGVAGLNFAVWAPDADALELCVFDEAGREERCRLPLPVCSEGVWHGFLPGAGPGLVYGLRAHGPWAPQLGHWFNPAKLLLDPWAQEVVGCYGRQGPGQPEDPVLTAELDLFNACRADGTLAPDARDNAAVAPKARVPAPPAPRPRPPRPAIARERIIIYEAHVRALTQRHPDIPSALRGSYAALAHPVMLAHYRALGITTLSLLPLHFRADESALQQRGLANHWGYAPLAWLAPETRYWSGRAGTTPAGELTEAIDTLHAAGLEVVLDVVFNHTAELDAAGPMLSLRGLVNARAYHLVPGNAAHYQDWTGCGNSVNLAEARMVELVLGALRHWAEHYRVDGFRFDLGTTLGRDRHGTFNRDAGLFAAIQADPQLAALKLIAEPWDIGAGGYQLGAFPAGWAEWNDQFRDTMRAWWLRGAGDRGLFAHRFAASAAQFHHGRRAPTASVNFLTAHDGFTLRDLVSYEHKHNHGNGEHNRDGQHHNASWNCGVEGPTDDGAVLALRARLQRALLATLLCAQGTPMLLAGDEIGHSQHGNNNAYCQDNDTTWLDWAGADQALLACVRRLLALRAALPALHQADWLRGPEHGGKATVGWLRPDATAIDAGHWADRDERALAILLCPPVAGEARVLMLVNPADRAASFRLPAGIWHPVVDSSRADGAPVDPPPLGLGGESLCAVPAHSVQLLVDRRPAGGIAGDDAPSAAASRPAHDNFVSLAASAAPEPSSHQSLKP
ncbi:glycogen debranching protein GlgX [Thauera sp. WH-1]|uniref:glycogen debranching protein GlgX n=1 Tax=Thauera sp. WH-1 TaxID=3398230 RepID=UPI0039FDB4C6